MNLIPLHSVILILDDSKIANMFPSHECLDMKSVEQDLVGSRNIHGISEFVFSELAKRMMAKLHMGERVVITISPNEKDRIDRITNLATNYGVPIFHIIDENNKEFSKGHGAAEIIFSNREIHPIQNEWSYEDIKEKFSGITVIGDIHGMHNSLLTVLSWARSRNHFIVLLGDILDYGYGSLEVVDEVYRIIMRGEGIIILGNHERKIFRWLEGRKTHLSEGNKVTVNLLNKLGETAKNKWISRFRGIYHRGYLYKEIGNVIFAHAAIHPSLWENPLIVTPIENFCLFGEVDTSNADKIVRTYKWVENVPLNKIAIIGHDIRSKTPYTETNEKGGQVVFLDTGSGKGGILSSADLKFTEEGFKLQSYKIS